MCRESGVAPADAHDLIDYAMSLDGVELAILFREQVREEPTTHVSLRSNGGVDVSRFAIERGGGGHPRAAGFSVGTPLELLRPAVVAAAEAALRNGR
jgi:phosphoesterase RecJ-like protein